MHSQALSLDSKNENPVVSRSRSEAVLWKK